MKFDSNFTDKRQWLQNTELFVNMNSRTKDKGTRTLSCLLILIEELKTRVPEH